MIYYGLLHRDTGQLTDISAGIPIGREQEGDIVELDSMPDYPLGTLLTYDAANRVAIPHVTLMQERDRERAAQLEREASPEWRAMADVRTVVVPDSGTDKLAFPDDILPQLAHRIKNLDLVDTPTPSILERLVKVAYFASLSKEESKLYPFTIAFLSTDGSPYTLPQRGWVPIVFNEPRLFTVAEIAKLAPALDSSQVVLCVRQAGDGELEIWGAVIVSRSVYRFKEGSAPGAFWMGPRHLRIHVPRPGNLVFEEGIARLLEYRLGEVVTDPIPVFQEDGPIFRLLQSYKWFRERPVLHPFGLLAQRILKLGQGGMVLLIKEEKTCEAVEILDLKYAQTHEFNYVRSLVERFELDNRSRALSNVRPYFWDDMLNHFSAQELWANIEEAIDAYAHLARVDGALVLTTRLGLVGFGARVKGDPVPAAYRALDSVGSKVAKFDLRTFGTRHNAAARFAYYIPDTLVYVCSEDGIPSFFMRRVDKLVLWRPVGLEFSLPVRTPGQ